MPGEVPHTPFAVATHDDEALPRVVVCGELDRWSGRQVTAALREQLSAHRHVLLDLSGVTFIDAGGIAVVWSAARTAARYGSQLEVRVSDAIARTLHRVGLDRHLPLVD